MIDKVIIAEDHESSNLSVEKTIEDLRIRTSDYVFYCDDALNKILAAKQRNEPYDLLITDLSFEDDGTTQKLKDGFELIRAVRDIQPEIMILVFSGEHRPAIIDELFTQYAVDAYVRKARHDIQELKLAFTAMEKGQRYYPRALAQFVKQANTYAFTDFDISIIRLIVDGRSQKEIADILKRSLSTVEKRLNRIRGELGFSKNEQLAVFCRDAGLL